MKKILLPLFSIAIITCASCVAITSCKPKPTPTPAPDPSEPDVCTFAVNWRTEDLEWSVGHALPVDVAGVPREWVWIDHPKIDCKFEVADGYELPDGIQLSSDGHLSGTPKSPFQGDVKFKAISDNYAPNLSQAIRFLINQEGSEPTPVSWTGDMWLQHGVSLDDNPMKVYKGNVEPGGIFTLREGFTLPDGLSLSDNGTLSGKPTKIGNFKISFEYRAKENATFETNYSPIYHINICYKHEITITIDHSNGLWVSNNLTLSMLSLDMAPINSFDLLTNWLHDNKSWEPTAYPVIGDMSNKHNADVWKIVGIALPAPEQMDKIKFYFDPTANPGFQMELSIDDFASIADTII